MCLCFLRMLEYRDERRFVESQAGWGVAIVALDGYFIDASSRGSLAFLHS